MGGGYQFEPAHRLAIVYFLEFSPRCIAAMRYMGYDQLIDNLCCKGMSLAIGHKTTRKKKFKMLPHLLFTCLSQHLR